MFSYTSGTIIFARARENYGILAADRMWYRPKDDTTGLHGKIILHPRLPIAVASAGSTYIRRPTGESKRTYYHANTYIKVLFSRIDRIDAGIPSLIKAELERLVLPGMTRDRIDWAEEFGIGRRFFGRSDRQTL